MAWDGRIGNFEQTLKKRAQKKISRVTYPRSSARQFKLLLNPSSGNYLLSFFLSYFSLFFSFIFFLFFPLFSLLFFSLIFLSYLSGEKVTYLKCSVLSLLYWHTATPGIASLPLHGRKGGKGYIIVHLFPPFLSAQGTTHWCRHHLA